MLVKRDPKVSVIVPVMNVAPYLRECLDSILAQTLSEIEVICGDGGSTDGSVEILQEYATEDSRIRVIRKPGSGYGQSMNDCMRLAKGKYIGIVESDDAILPDMYETLYRTAEKDALDWVRGDIYLCDTSKAGEHRRRYEKIIIGNFYNRVLNPRVDPRPYRCRLRTWSGIYRRSFLEKYGINHNETPGAAYQDVGFYLKTLYYAERVSFVHQAFYMWRQDNGTSSIHFDTQRLVERSSREWELNWEFFCAAKDLGQQALYGFQYRQFLAFMWMIDCADGPVKDRIRKSVQETVATTKQSGKYDRNFFTTREWRQMNRFIRTGDTEDLRRKLHGWIQNFPFRKDTT